MGEEARRKIDAFRALFDASKGFQGASLLADRVCHGHDAELVPALRDSLDGFKGGAMELTPDQAEFARDVLRVGLAFIGFYAVLKEDEDELEALGQGEG
jgi:hypothetical protein